MVKKQDKINLLVKRNLVDFLSEQGIKRVGEGSFELIEDYVFKNMEFLSEQFKEEMLVSCKRTLDKDIVKRVLSRQDKIAEILELGTEPFFQNI